VRQVLGDVRQAVRGLLRAPGFAALSIATLGLGIGATTATYSIISASLTARIPVRDIDRVVALYAFDRTNGQPRVVASPADVDAWRERQRTFEGVSAMQFGGVNVSGIDQAVRASAAFVTASYFSVVGIPPALGRPFTEDENAPGAARVAILNDRVWRNRFEGQPDVVGRTILLDGQATTIVGVMPPDDFTPEILRPLTIDPGAPDHTRRALLVAARLKPDVTLEQARAEMNGIAAQLERERPETHRGWGASVFPYRDEFLGRTEELVYAFLGLTALAVLLIGCANIANLLLARGTTRSTELALRAALGASRANLLRLMLTEGVVLSLAGGVTGLALAWGALRLLLATFWQSPPIFLQERAVIGAGAVWVAFGASAAATIAFALLPALHQARVAETLVGGARAIGNRRLTRLRGTLVAAEVAAASLLLVLALLISRTLVNLWAVEPGFDTRNLLLMDVSLPEAVYSSPDAAARFYERVTARLAAAPAVVAAGAASRVPVRGSALNASRTMAVEGRPALGDEARSVDDQTVTAGYLEALGVPLRSGRLLTASDDAASPLVIVVSDTTARRFWGDMSPLGARVRLGDEESVDAWRTVVGVVGDIRNDDIDQPAPPYVFVPAAQRPVRAMTILLRSQGDPLAHVGPARAAVAADDPNLPVHGIQTMEQLLAEDLRGPAVLASLMGTLSGMALVLAAIGIYGMVAYAVAQRTREIAVRLALGARRRDVAGHVFGQGTGWVCSGLVLGLLAALGLSRLLAAVLYGVASTDPATYVSVAGLLAAVAALACLGPLARALRLSPIAALRQP
jgi:putative ABC transport system permease protein